MKKSTVLHGVSIITGILGGFALIGAWLAGDDGTALGFSQQHLYNDAIVLELIAVGAGICALYRRQLEQRNQ